MNRLNRPRLGFWSLFCDVLLQLTILLLVKLATVQETLVEVSDQRDGAVAAAVGLGEQLGTAEGELVNLGERLADAEGRAVSLGEQLTAAEDDGGNLRQEIAGLEGEVGRLRPGGRVELVILTDCTGSMEPHIERLKGALKSLLRWTPRLASSCRVSVVAVRDGVAETFPLREIGPPGADDSQADLLAFVGELEPVSSPVDHGPAFAAAFEMLGPPPADGGRQIVLALSDTGQTERDGRPGYSADETAEAEAITAVVREWASASGRAVGIVYVGPETAGDPTFDWFAGLSNPAGENFATDSAAIFQTLYDALESE